jgi:hypothetical protein
VKDIFNDPNELKVLKIDLAYVHANLSFVIQSRIKFKMTTTLLSKAIKDINDMQDKLGKNSGLKTDRKQQHFAHVSVKIKDLKPYAIFHVYYRQKIWLILKICKT